MQKNIPERPTFLMVTDTAMVTKNGRVYAFGPVVMEILVFQKLFSSIEWIGFNRRDMINDSVLLPVPRDVRCTMLQPSGGHGWIDKMKVLIRLPVMFWYILICIRGKQVIHTRAPSSPAFLATILSFFLPKKIWWHKYAGNWGEKHPPYFYALQRQLLARSNWSKVTINGSWPSQPAHILSFQNPCIDERDISIGNAIMQNKDYTSSLNICFVGHLSLSKGADKLIAALPSLSAIRIASVHIIGEGPLKEDFEKIISNLPFPVVLHGYLGRNQIQSIYSMCHLQILPSLSEGFPKVIAEGSNYGCIPIVSDISAISQTISDGVNGFLLSPARIASGFLGEDVNTILARTDLPLIARSAHKISNQFTFERYYERIQNEILNMKINSLFLD